MWWLWLTTELHPSVSFLCVLTEQRRAPGPEGNRSLRIRCSAGTNPSKAVCRAVGVPSGNLWSLLALRWTTLLTTMETKWAKVLLNNLKFINFIHSLFPCLIALVKLYPSGISLCCFQTCFLLRWVVPSLLHQWSQPSLFESQMRKWVTYKSNESVKIKSWGRWCMSEHQFLRCRWLRTALLRCPYCERSWVPHTIKQRSQNRQQILLSSVCPCDEMNHTEKTGFSRGVVC